MSISKRQTGEERTFLCELICGGEAGRIEDVIRVENHAEVGFLAFDRMVFLGRIRPTVPNTCNFTNVLSILSHTSDWYDPRFCSC